MINIIKKIMNTARLKTILKKIIESSSVDKQTNQNFNGKGWNLYNVPALK